MKKEKFNQQKQRIASFYQKLLYTCLEDCLQKFCRKDVEYHLRSYLEFCISISFFRVPQFQKLFIECLQEKGNEDIPEWRGLNWQLSAKEDDNNFESPLMHLFDWEDNFYKFIPNSEENQESQKILRRIIYKDKWQHRLKKRSVAFFQIVLKWVDVLYDAVQTYHVSWQDIPGYKEVLKAFLLEMKEIDIVDYPDSLVEASLAFLRNT